MEKEAISNLKKFEVPKFNFNLQKLDESLVSFKQNIKISDGSSSRSYYNSSIRINAITKPFESKESIDNF